MDNSFQTSFIPKKAMTANGGQKEPKSLFSMISLFLLIVTLLAAGGVYLYKNYLIKQEEGLSASLTKTRDTFEKDTLEELEMFNKRSLAATQILSKHLVLSPFFARLSEITIPSVQYKNFDYQSGVNAYTVSIKGIAKDYRSIAQQSDAFNTAKGRSFKNVLFSDLTRDKNNYVTFSLSFEIEPDLLSYEKSSMIPTAKTNPIAQPKVDIKQDTLPAQEESTLPSSQEGIIN